MSISKYIKNNSITVLARPNSPKTNIIKWDNVKQALRVNVHARPERGKANIEIIKFFKKLTKKEVTIISGLKSHKKVLKFF